MITKQEIKTRASIKSLHSHVIEKNYVLGWLLAGIFNHKELSDKWLFKGGTCIKQCYFETYRFSEDLDFTLKDKNHLDIKFLEQTFKDISKWMENESGITFPFQYHSFEVYNNPFGQLNCKGAIAYIGPVSPQQAVGGFPKIKIDLTADETVVLPPIKKQISHPYKDFKQNKFHIMSYDYEEIFAEKIRALVQRANPRDLYDVISLYRNPESKPNLSLLKNVLHQKCEYKNIPTPVKLENVMIHKNQIDASWKDMLDHQLPHLPSVEHYWNTLKDFFNWLNSEQSKDELTSVELEKDQILVKEPSYNLPLEQTSTKRIVDQIRFASINQLCIKIKYHDENQDLEYLLEAYALGKKEQKHLILYAWDTEKKQEWTYLITRIKFVEITNQAFKPKYKIDIIPKLNLLS